MESARRIVRVLWAPAETFRRIAERPTWGLALVILLVLSGAVGLAALQRIDPDAQRDQLRAAFEERGLRGDELERQVEQVTAWNARFAPVAPAIGVAAGALGYLLVAGVFLVAFRLAGGELGFIRSLSVTLHGMMPHAVAAVLALPVILSRESLDPAAVQRGSFLESSLASLAPADASDTLLAFLSTLDLFSLWAVILLVLGFRIVARVSTASAGVVVGGAWLAWIGVRVGLAAVFS